MIPDEFKLIYKFKFTVLVDGTGHDFDSYIDHTFVCGETMVDAIQWYTEHGLNLPIVSVETYAIEYFGGWVRCDLSHLKTLDVVTTEHVNRTYYGE